MRIKLTKVKPGMIVKIYDRYGDLTFNGIAKIAAIERHIIWIWNNRISNNHHPIWSNTIGYKHSYGMTIEDASTFSVEILGWSRDGPMVDHDFISQDALAHET